MKNLSFKKCGCGDTALHGYFFEGTNRFPVKILSVEAVNIMLDGLLEINFLTNFTETRKTLLDMVRAAGFPESQEGATKVAKECVGILALAMVIADVILLTPEPENQLEM